MYKERNDDHFYFGPIWDFDKTFDNDGYLYPMYKENKFLFEYGYTKRETSKLIEKIVIDENVIKKIKSLWKNVHENIIKNDYINMYIDSLVKIINESQKINFIRWNILDKALENLDPIVKYTYENEIISLKKYIKNRMKWMNLNILTDNLYQRYKNNNMNYIEVRYKLIIIFIILLC